MHQEELHNRAQALTGSLQKIQHEKEPLLKDIAAMKENLSKVSHSLKESQMHMEKQKQNGKEAFEQKERINQKGNREFQKKAEMAVKEGDKVKSLLQEKDEAEKELNSQLTSVITAPENAGGTEGESIAAATDKSKRSTRVLCSREKNRSAIENIEVLLLRERRVQGTADIEDLPIMNKSSRCTELPEELDLKKKLNKMSSGRSTLARC